jgi:hypothetical protein
MVAAGEKPTQTAMLIKIAIVFLWCLFISSVILPGLPQISKVVSSVLHDLVIVCCRD